MDINNKNKENIISEEITNLDGFLRRQEGIEEYMQVCKFRRRNHLKLQEKVLKLEKILSIHFNENIDPIRFLEKLYREENFSIDWIVKYLKDIYDKNWEEKYFYKNYFSLQAFLSWVLNWKLKDQKENKKTSTYKSRLKPSQLIAKNQEEKDKRKALFLSWYIKNSNLNKDNFNYNEFENLKFKYEKFIYLLENYFMISKDSYQKLLEIDLWNQSFADRFNEIFKENNINFEISHKDVARVFEKYKNN